jgi:hypothetical protein
MYVYQASTSFVNNWMKALITIIGFFFWAFPCFAQTGSYSIMVEDALRSRYQLDKIVYVDSSILFYPPFSRFARKGVVSGFLGRSAVSMKFSSVELRLIDKAMATQKREKWPDSLFTNGLLITHDSLVSVFSHTDKGQPYFEKVFSRYYFYFSGPLLLRNNTLAIFRTLEMIHPSAGYARLYIYEHQDGRWKQKMWIQEGAF